MTYYKKYVAVIRFNDGCQPLECDFEAHDDQDAETIRRLYIVMARREYGKTVESVEIFKRY